MRFAFIQAYRRRWPVNVMCRVLRVTRSGFYAWRGRRPGARQRRRERLTGKIRVVHDEHRRVYGSPRVHHVLRDQGERVCVNTVAKLMRQQRIRAKSKPKFTPRTTDSTHNHAVAVNKLDRKFTAAQPDRKWVADITYVRTEEGWLYVAAILDLCTRRIVGWSMADHLRSELVGDALMMALQRRGLAKGMTPTDVRVELPGALPGVGGEGLLHHSDRGVQYASDQYQTLLTRHGIVCSMSRRGNCYDNAAMESFWATLKTELVHHERYATREQAKASIFEYIEVFYNRKRLHSALGYMSPEMFEARLD